MNIRRILLFFLVILLLAIFSILYPNLQQLTGHATNVNNFYLKETAILERVIDGDTIVYRIGNTSQTARLLGINTPEKKMPYSESGKEFLKQFENITMLLERDKEDIDKYNRKLRYLYFEGRFINKEILENGWANSYYTSGLIHEKELLNAEKTAKNSEAGIWEHSQEECASCISLISLDPLNESFLIKSNCEIYCNLEGWFVKDAGRNIFYLNSLNPGQETFYFSPSGKSVWNDDSDRFFIFDKFGKLVLFYEYY